MESGILKKTSARKLQNFLKILGPDYYREGLHYYKLLEYPLVINGMNLKRDSRVLDIGSGRSFLPLYFAHQGIETWIVDNGEFYPDFADFYSRVLKQRLPLGEDFLNIIQEDFLNVDLPTDYYDNIIAVSSLEHFPDSGDIKAVMRISSLLKKGGRFIVTVPFSQAGTKERVLSENNITYFQRDYSLDCLYKRIIELSNLQLKYYIIIGERNPYWGGVFFFRKPLAKFHSFWIKFLANFFWRVYYQGKSRKLKQFKYPGVAIIVFEKQ